MSLHTASTASRAFRCAQLDNIAQEPAKMARTLVEDSRVFAGMVRLCGVLADRTLDGM